MATNPADMTPVEIDTIVSDLYNEQMKYWGLIKSQVRHIEHLRKGAARRQQGDLTPLINEIDKVNEVLESYRQKQTDAAVAALPYEAEHNRRRWNRYFLVRNVNGHVHRGMDCSTCFRDTEYSWLVDLADCDEDAMIEEWGERACTVCFPTAPTNPAYHRPARVDREAQEAKAAEKAAKAAAQAEKGILDVDGSPLRVGGDLLKTKVAARNALSAAFQSLVFYGDHPSDFEGQIRKLVPALEAAGVDWKPVAARAIKRAVKDSEVPAHNPWRLTPEQITAHSNEIAANAARAQTVLKEVEHLDS